MQCISDYNAERPTVHAYSARDAAVHQAKKSIGPSATVSLVKNVQADDCQWYGNGFPWQQSLLPVLISKNQFPQTLMHVAANDKLPELQALYTMLLPHVLAHEW